MGTTRVIFLFDQNNPVQYPKDISRISPMNVTLLQQKRYKMTKYCICLASSLIEVHSLRYTYRDTTFANIEAKIQLADRPTITTCDYYHGMSPVVHTVVTALVQQWQSHYLFDNFCHRRRQPNLLLIPLSCLLDIKRLGNNFVWYSGVGSN